ncbi:MAG: hypothetical protein K6G15_04825 [Desulfovibrio sp.]|nr:hypothetical protein [Desulfovibrio sp.]
MLSPDFHGPRITVLLQPEGRTLSLPRCKTVWQLLKALDLPEESALVAREGILLTHDCALAPNDIILVRKVASRG